MTDKELAEALATKIAGYGGRTFYVGGCVRDELMGIPCGDLDIEVHGITPQKLERILTEFGDVRKQGTSFGVYKLGSRDIDIAMPRVERSTGDGHRDFEVNIDPFLGYEQAAKRRDFTMNAIMKDVLSGEYVDPYNGIADIKNHVIRHVDDKTFVEDPLRVLRGAEFKSRFGDFVIADSTENLMKTIDLSSLSKERVYDQTVKALAGDKPSVYFEELRKIDQLSSWYPELEALINCEQNPEYHPEGDAWTHTMMVVDNAAKIKFETNNPEYFMMAALVHDVGKPGVACINSKGVISHVGHDIKGVDVANEFLSRLTDDKKQHRYVEDMVKQHMKPHFLYDSRSKISKTNALFDDCVDGHDLIRLTASDSCNVSDDYIKDFITWFDDRNQIYQDRMKEDYVKGDDLLKIGFKSGPDLAPILANAKKQHLSGQNKISVIKGIVSVHKNKIPDFDEDRVNTLIDSMIVSQSESSEKDIV